jgi:outer membrane receptor for ferrienterochelin and colicins
MRDRFLLGFPIALLLGLALAQPALAQTGTISGLVRSAETGAPLPAAVVQVTTADGGRIGSSITNQAGRFLIAAVPPGSYTVLVAITGYETVRREGVAVAAGQTAALNFDLISRAIDLDPVVVSASRRQERALDAPARVEVVTAQVVQARPTVTPVDHLRSLPGIDVATHGLQATNVVARGFNNIFSGSLYTLTDHRIAGVPSLRVNLMHLVPLTNEDIERIEVVLGPGSALYGPNTANGVLHIFTRSPLVEQGTAASIAGGERSLFTGSARTAHLLNENFGIKVSGQYLRGEEWPYTDPVEVQARARAIAADPNTRIGLRDFSIERWSGEARADWRITPDLTTVFQVGRTTAMDGIELTGIGAAQVQDWTYTYYQLRTNLGRLFAQVYLNESDAGDTYTLREGQQIIDRSRVFVAQAQHAVTPWARQNFTYGLDYIRTMPNTEGTVHGRYEDIDQYDEFGGYLQSETALSPQFDLVLAGRLDTHTELPDAVFSPRAALVFKPSQNHSLRATFNRAFSTPRSLDMFLDIGAGPFPSPLLAPLGYTARAMGPGREGFTFRTEDGALTGMRSPFNPAATGGPGAVLPANTPTMWALAVGVLQARGAVDAQTAAYLRSLNPTDAQIGIMGQDVLVHQAPVPIDQVQIDAFGPLRESRTTTFEVGYKGILGQRLLFAADVWHSRRTNFISALRPVTPLLFLNGQQIAPFLVQRGIQPQVAAQLAAGIAQIPVGVVSSEAVSGNTANFLVTYRNFGEIDLWGSDLSAQYLLTDEFSLMASASFVSDDMFETEGQRIPLNAPTTKLMGAVQYRNEGRGLTGEFRVRHNNEFPVISAPYFATGCIEPAGDLIEPCVAAFTLADLTLGYRLPPVPGATLQLAVQNLFDTGYRSFPGVPEIGRLAILRLRYEF